MLLQDGIFPAPVVLPRLKEGPASGERFLFLRIRINIYSDIIILNITFYKVLKNLENFAESLKNNLTTRNTCLIITFERRLL